MKPNELKYQLKGKDRCIRFINTSPDWVQVIMQEEAWIPKQQLIAYLKQNEVPYERAHK